MIEITISENVIKTAIPILISIAFAFAGLIFYHISKKSKEYSTGLSKFDLFMALICFLTSAIWLNEAFNFISVKVI